MKKLFISLFLLPLLSAGQMKLAKNASTTEGILRELRNPQGKNVLVIAHRGDWRNAPENSIQAIKNVINFGVDIVELDVQKTKDGQLVLMHDATIDRTTTGKGKTTDHTLEEIKKFYLRNGAGVATRHRIPTLEEALLCSKDKILVNIDKGYEYFRECYEVMERTGTVGQVIIKGNAAFEKVNKENAEVLRKVIYMPIVDLGKPVARTNILDFQRRLKPAAYELVFKSDTSSILNEFKKIKAEGSRVWVNSLWSSLNAGHDDDLSVEEGKPEEGWGWIIAKGANMIQTDRPEELLAYLRKRGLHK